MSYSSDRWIVAYQEGDRAFLYTFANRAGAAQEFFDAVEDGRYTNIRLIKETTTTQQYLEEIVAGD